MTGQKSKELLTRGVNKTTKAPAQQLNSTTSQQVSDISQLNRQVVTAKGGKYSGVGINPSNIPLSASNILALQRTVGNQAVMRLMEQQNQAQSSASIQRLPTKAQVAEKVKKAGQMAWLPTTRVFYQSKNQYKLDPSQKDDDVGVKSDQKVQAMNSQFTQEDQQAEEASKYLQDKQKVKVGLGGGNRNGFDADSLLNKLIELDKSNPKEASNFRQKWLSQNSPLKNDLILWNRIEMRLEVSETNLAKTILDQVTSTKIKTHLEKKITDVENKVKAPTGPSEGVSKASKISDSVGEGLETVGSVSDNFVGRANTYSTLVSNALATPNTDAASMLSSQTNLGADFTGIIGDSLGVISQLNTNLQQTLKLFSGDKAKRKEALYDLLGNLLDNIKTAASFGSNIASAINDLQTMLNVASTAAQASAILGAITGFFSGLKSAYEGCFQFSKIIGSGANAYKAKKSGSKNTEIYMGIQSHLGWRNAELVIRNTLSTIFSAAQVAAGICTASGVAAPVGAGLTIAATACSALLSLSSWLADAARAGSVQATRNEYKKAKLNNKTAIAQGQAFEMLTSDPKFVTQFLVTKARRYAEYKASLGSNQQPTRYKGAKTAMDTLWFYGISEKMLLDETAWPDQKLREWILTRLQESEDPKTVGDQLVGAINALKELPEKTTKKVNRHNYVSILAKIKNAMNYGNENKRGGLWKAKQWFAVYKSVEDYEKAIKELKAIMTPLEEGQVSVALASEPPALEIYNAL